MHAAYIQSCTYIEDGRQNKKKKLEKCQVLLT